MGLFFGKKKSKGTNEIQNAELKNTLKQKALDQLTPGADYTEMAYTSCDFGYLFLFEGRGVEALLKVVTDRTTVYFAVQGDTFTRQKYNEDMYKSTVSAYLALHP